jgi:hypothetical protein
MDEFNRMTFTTERHNYKEMHFVQCDQKYFGKNYQNFPKLRQIEH